MIIGYTVGTFDLFHVGHVRLLERARAMCDKLIVGVNKDEFIVDHKPIPIIPLFQRVEILRACRCVDLVTVPEVLDKMDARKKLKFNVFFVGGDWYNTDEWNRFERDFKGTGVTFIYLPHTKGISTSIIRDWCM